MTASKLIQINGELYLLEVQIVGIIGFLFIFGHFFYWPIILLNGKKQR